MCRIDLTPPDSSLRIVVKTSKPRASAQQIVNTIAQRHRARQEQDDTLGLGDLMRRYGEPQASGAWGDFTQSARA